MKLSKFNKLPYLSTEIREVEEDFQPYCQTGTSSNMVEWATEGYYGCKLHSENIDRIKLPCFCTFEWRGKRRLGEIKNASYRGKGIKCSNYVLYEVDKQTHRLVGGIIDLDANLEKLINDNKINIGKVRIIYWERG